MYSKKELIKNTKMELHPIQDCFKNSENYKKELYGLNLYLINTVRPMTLLSTSSTIKATDKTYVNTIHIAQNVFKQKGLLSINDIKLLMISASFICMAAADGGTGFLNILDQAIGLKKYFSMPEDTASTVKRICYDVVNSISSNTKPTNILEQILHDALIMATYQYNTEEMFKFIVGIVMDRHYNYTDKKADPSTMYKIICDIRSMYSTNINRIQNPEDILAFKYTLDYCEITEHKNIEYTDDDIEHYIRSYYNEVCRTRDKFMKLDYSRVL